MFTHRRSRLGAVVESAGRAGDSRLKGHSIYGGEGGTDVWREEKDEERRLRMERSSERRRLMKLKGEAVSEGKWEDKHLKIIGEKEK